MLNSPEIAEENRNFHDSCSVIDHAVQFKSELSQNRISRGRKTMGKVFDTIDEEMENWIRQRELFFVATAPLSSKGLLNCSPKGLDSFRVLGPTTVGYVDITGSGIETAAHLQENGRIVIMFCAFDGPPKIVRLYGTGKFHSLDSREFDRWKHRFGNHVGVRGMVEVNLTRISDSCGFGVPKFEFKGQRETLSQSLNTKSEPELVDYRRRKNSHSIEGLPGI